MDKFRGKAKPKPKKSAKTRAPSWDRDQIARIDDGRNRKKPKSKSPVKKKIGQPVTHWDRNQAQRIDDGRNKKPGKTSKASPKLKPGTKKSPASASKKANVTTAPKKGTSPRSKKTTSPRTKKTSSPRPKKPDAPDSKKTSIPGSRKSDADDAAGSKKTSIPGTSKKPSISGSTYPRRKSTEPFVCEVIPPDWDKTPREFKLERFYESDPEASIDIYLPKRVDVNADLKEFEAENVEHKLKRLPLNLFPPLRKPFRSGKKSFTSWSTHSSVEITPLWPVRFGLTASWINYIDMLNNFYVIAYILGKFQSAQAKKYKNIDIVFHVYLPLSLLGSFLCNFLIWQYDLHFKEAFFNPLKRIKPRIYFGLNFCITMAQGILVQNYFEGNLRMAIHLISVLVLRFFFWICCIGFEVSACSCGMERAAMNFKPEEKPMPFSTRFTIKAPSTRQTAVGRRFRARLAYQKKHPETKYWFP